MKLRKKLIGFAMSVMSLCMIGGTVASLGTSRTANADDQKILNVYVVLGQSNAAGCTAYGLMSEENIKSQYSQGFDNVYYYGRANDQYVTDLYTPVKFGQGLNVNCMGPEIGIADIVSQRNEESLIIKYGIGSTYLVDVNTVGNNWCPPSMQTANSDSYTGKLYEGTINTISEAVRAYKLQGYTIDFEGTFWMQGESEAVARMVYSKNYEGHLKALISDLRNDYISIFGVEAESAPFAIGKIAPTMCYGEGGQVEEIRQIQEKVASSTSDVHCIETEDYILIDPVTGAIKGQDKYHFHANDMLSLGKSVGELMSTKTEYTVERYKDILNVWEYGGEYDESYLKGKEVANGNTLVNAMWIQSTLKSNTGFEFKMNMTENAWNAMPGKDSTWYSGSWSNDARNEGGIQITVDSFHEMLIYKNAAGKLAINSKNCKDGVTKTVVLEGRSFVGEHTYRYVNVAGADGGAQTRLYIDGVLVFTHSTAVELGGNHFLVWNYTGQTVTVKTLKKTYTQEIYDDVYDLTGDETFCLGKAVADATYPIEITGDFSVNNGIVFKTTISQEKWAQVPVFDATNWNGEQPTSKGALFIETEGFNAMILYKTDKGLAVSSKMLVGDDKITTMVLDGYTLEDKHVYRVVNVNGEYEGAKACLYLDGELVYTIETDECLNGNQFKVGNWFGVDITFRSTIIKSEYVPENYAYSMMVVPDTQNVNYFHTKYFSNIYDYIVDNVEAKNVQHVFGLGDITQIDTTDEWVRAKQQITRMDGLVSYSLVRGNHDLNNNNTGWEYTFGANSSYSKQYIAKYRNSTKNTVHAFSVGQLDYMVVALDYGASDEVLEWAGNIIAANPYHNVIITTHAYLDNDGGILDDDGSHPPTLDGGVNNADDYWDKLVGQYENIVMIISGHMTGCILNERQGVHGNTVKQLLLDFQNYEAEGLTPLGIVNTLYFSEDGKTVTLDTYSTIQEKYYNAANQFTFTLDTVERNESLNGFVDTIPDADAFELFGDADLIDGKTLKHGEALYKHWMEADLTKNNGFTFKATISEETWDSFPALDAKYGGTPTMDESGIIYLETTGFHELYIYKTENGVGCSSKMWKGNALTGAVEIPGLSLAGEHTYRYMNVTTANGAQSRLYIDGELVYSLSTTAALQGYHQRLYNFTGSDIIVTTTLDMSKNIEVSTDIYDYSGDAELLWTEGKTLGNGQSIGKWWMSGQLLGANGFEFNAIVSNWDSWTEGDYNSGLTLKIDSYHDLYLYKTANGIGIYSKIWVGAGESKTVELVGYTLEGLHHYKMTNVNNYGLGSTSKLYLDGELVFTATTTGDLRGYHSYLVNKTGSDINVFTSTYDRSLVVVGEPQNTDIFAYSIETLTGGISEVNAHSVYWNNMACSSAFDIMFRLDTTNQRWDNDGAAGYVYYSFGTGASAIGVSLYKNHGDSDKPYVWIYDWSGKVNGYGQYLENNFNGEIGVHISLVDVRYKGVLLGIKCTVEVNGETVVYVLARDYASSEAQFYIDNNTSVAMKYSSDLEGFRNIYEKKFNLFDVNAYTDENWALVSDIITQAKVAMSEATDVTNICNIGDKAMSDANAIWTIAQQKELADCKVAAKAEAETYIVFDDYYEEQQVKITAILDNFYIAVDNSKTTQEIAIRLADVKTLLDAIAMKDVMDQVAIYRIVIKADMEVLMLNYKQADYSAGNWQSILDIKASYITLLDNSESIDELEMLIDLMSSELDAIKTLEEEPDNGGSSEIEEPNSSDVMSSADSTSTGCKSIIGLNAVVLIFTFAAATIVIKKRERKEK